MLYTFLYIHVHVHTCTYTFMISRNCLNMYIHVCTMFRHICTVLPNPVQVVRIPDACTYQFMMECILYVHEINTSISCSDMYVLFCPILSRWVGFQMKIQTRMVQGCVQGCRKLEPDRSSAPRPSAQTVHLTRISSKSHGLASNFRFLFGFWH